MPPLTWLSKLIIYGLAVFRLARLISLEDGPGGLFKHVRQWFGVKIHTTQYTVAILDRETGQWKESLTIGEQEFTETPLARFITCPLCVSAWLALPAVISLWLEWLFGDIIASWLAIASITVILHRDD